jgi:hypothetical protein
MIIAAVCRAFAGLTAKLAAAAKPSLRYRALRAEATSFGTLAVGAPVSICRSPGAHPSSHRDNDCEAMVKSLPNCGELGTGGWRNGFSSLWLVVNEMPFTLTVLLEESVQIAWDYLVRTGEIDDPSEAVRFLTEVIETMIRQGTKSRLLLSNRAITAYQKRNVGLKEQTAWRIQEWRPWSS